MALLSKMKPSLVSKTGILPNGFFFKNSLSLIAIKKKVKKKNKKGKL
jgi:hypothetical protein